MANHQIPDLRQLRLVSSTKDGRIFLCVTSHKDRSRVLSRLDVTDQVLTVAVQNLCFGVPRDDTHFTTVRMPSGNYRIYIREISDIEADRYHEEFKAEQAIYGDNDF
ncbi:hypothetical protein D0Q53_20355 [Salmonella enterica]|nr:hypothetical protein [Salmonella enterica]EFF4796196.1 hypothetical protein [Escherichia coli]EBJ6658270.1 hypothetical protein [Salmonella enterica]EBL0923882.1 hypothetical protein [Salmonella enterica]ECO7324787.1 hypothetical protein [Salmonella enterica]